MFNGMRIAALCISRIQEATNHKLITSLSRCMSERGYRLMVFATPSELYWNTIDEQGEKSVFELINYSITDIIIIQAEMLKCSELVLKIVSDAKAHGIPIITIGGDISGCVRIGFDYAAGFEKMVRHVLCDHNITNFHLMAGIKDNPFSEERIDVVRRVTKELDIPFCDEDISYGGFWSRPTEEAIETLFTRRRRLPQAMICVNDSMAIAAVAKLKSHGLRIPQDIIVTGFDGINEVNYSDPRITTALCSNEQLAQSIADTADRILSGEDIPQSLLVVPELQKSESCGCGSGSPINASAELSYINNSFNRYQNEEERMFRMMSRFMECRTISQTVAVMERYDFYDIVVALNPESIDSTVDPFDSHPMGRAGAFTDTVKVILNTNAPMNGRIDDMSTTSLHPQLAEMLRGFTEPLIFFSLNYMGVTMGYVCFNFHDYDIQNYYKASQTVNALNSAFGAYRTMQYQHYLTDTIEKMYRCDGLTHLLNRTALKNEFKGLLDRCGGKLTVVLADLDGLKTINDTYGHDDGDFAICALADALRESCPENALCVRWGGDEMVAVIAGEYSSEAIRSGLDQRLNEVNAQSGKQYKISASVGVRTFSTDVTSRFEDMVRDTDQLMYSEKSSKKQHADIVRQR